MSGPGWEAAGRQIAPMLGSYSSAVVTASDELEAAHVAIGIGLAEAEHRRVAIADLVGEVDPIQSLVSSDDPHGISDSFTYGVSLNKIAQPIDTTGNLFVMPSGTGSVSDPAIFRNARWQRLTNGFREVGALLLLVAPADAPALRELIDQTDGVVLVGSSPLDLAPYLNVLARVPAPIIVPEHKARKRQIPLWQLIIYGIILLALVGVGVYMRYGNMQAAQRPTPAFRHRSAVVTPAPVAAATPQPAETLVVAPAENPADSLHASSYAVELEAWNAQEDAVVKLQQSLSDLPAGTIAPVPVGTSRELYYKLIAGAFPNRREAEVFLDVLRHKQVLQDLKGTVVRTPYDLLLDSAVAGHT